MRFFLGTHRPRWLTLTSAPLFISDRILRTYKTLPSARGPWALDSGGFTELQKYGSWDHGPTPAEYAARVRRYRDEIGGQFCFAAPQDWMCEPIIISGGIANGQRFVGTGLSVLAHQRRTVANFLHLRAIAPDLPFIPVLQGWTSADYLSCAHLYGDAGVDLAAEPTVGIGSVCRRQATGEAADIIAAVRDAIPGIRLHGFGIKISGLAAYGSHLSSCDSMAWSMAARREARLAGCTGHARCANCPRYAFRWRERVLASLAAHATRTPPLPALNRTRRHPPSTPALVIEQRLALAAFRVQAARIERDHAVRAAHTQHRLSARAVADLTGLRPGRVRQICAQPAPGMLNQLRAARIRWGVDNDLATRAGADVILAHAVATATATVTAEASPETYRDGEGDS